ncbi:M3 family oligoendopeptidase [Paenibacillus riograndensis]|uniref:PepF/M3 family oligoendopeptidase n=1 Tax=Paenibacillus riograndensis SBR5 TaxID=1073571 RepID=A0A0E4D007_9BACL|nr:M3 family oligoendopeptidase [Paenibacillus riograndensis]CQR59120.1 pepF/M3 family oligoendopeptidase [Paenibacillus riograndensis SBR5]
MELTWELDSLYPSFQSEKYWQDRRLLTEYTERLIEWAAGHFQNRTQNEKELAQAIEQFLKQYNAYKRVYHCLFSYAELRFSLDRSDAEAMNRMDELEDAAAAAGEAHAGFSKWLAGVADLKAVIASSAYLAGHEFYLYGLQRQSEHLLGEEAESVIARMQSTGSKAWERLYMRTLSMLRMDVQIGGQARSLSLAELQNLAYDGDAGVRKAAYEAEREACRSVEEQSAACLNSVSGEALAIYGLRGYASPLHKVLKASRMNRKTLEVMLEAIEESLPFFHQYYMKKAALLGHSGPLPFYDVFAPLAEESSAKITYPEAGDVIVSGFSAFSPELGEFARKVFRQRWIDAEPREGKGNFGMCVDIFPIGESRIITSFTGNYIDVSVLAHEIGHAYHSSCLAGETMVNTDYPVPVAETASIFCESLIHEELLNMAAESEALAIRERSLSDAGYYIVDFYARYLFESRLYERRQSGPLSAHELNDLMHESMVAAYGGSVDPATFHPYQWISKAGYYMAGNEFLNFPYSFGLLFSKGLYAQYKKQGGDFAERYRSFLAATSKNTIADAAGLMNIDVDSPQFWRDALALIAEDIQEFVESV